MTGVGYMIEESRIWAHYAMNPELFLFVFKCVTYLCSDGFRAGVMMISHVWNKCAFEQSRHLWVSSWIPPLVSRILFDPMILVALSLDGHSCWVITRAAPLYKQIDLVIRDGVGYMIEESQIWAHYAMNPRSFLFVFKGIAYLCSGVYSRLM